MASHQNAGKANGWRTKRVKHETKKAIVLENDGNLLISDDEDEEGDEFRDAGEYE